jgi:hypothetical protein
LAVYRDFDPIEGTFSIACMTCGNRYPGGHDFYMKEVTVKKDCKNCKRLMSIVRHGMCFVCAKAHDSAPEGPEREAALAAVREKAERGELGHKPHTPKKLKDKDRKDTIIPMSRGRDGRLSVSHDDPSLSRGATSDLTISIRFDEEDRPTFDKFMEICRKQRRTPELQVLAMIDLAVA